MKKQFYKRYFFWIAIVVVIAVGIFLAVALRHVKTISDSNASVASLSQPEQSIENSSEGYAFSIPSSWYVENSATNTVVVYPDYSPANSSSAPTCKVEMSVFAYASSESVSDWISHRLSADPTVNVAEQSSEAISVRGALAAIKWIGTMNAIPTTVVYAFSDVHAYEIVPSSLSGDESCQDALGLFLQKLTI